MNERKIQDQLSDVEQGAEEISRMLERTSTSTRILDIVTVVELLDEEAVVEYHEEPDKDRHAVVVIAKEELNESQLNALQNYINNIDGWHLDDRERKNNTWKIRPH